MYADRKFLSDSPETGESHNQALFSRSPAVFVRDAKSSDVSDPSLASMGAVTFRSRTKSICGRSATRAIRRVGKTPRKERRLKCRSPMIPSASFFLLSFSFSFAVMTTQRSSPFVISLRSLSYSVISLRSGKMLKKFP